MAIDCARASQEKSELLATEQLAIAARDTATRELVRPAEKLGCMRLTTSVH